MSAASDASCTGPRACARDAASHTLSNLGSQRARIDLAVRLHVAQAVAEETRASRGKRAAPPNPVGSRTAAWQLVQDVVELRLAHALIAHARADFGRAGVNVSRLGETLAILMVFGRVPALERFAAVISERAHRLARVAHLSTRFGLSIHQASRASG